MMDIQMMDTQMAGRYFAKANFEELSSLVKDIPEGPNKEKTLGEWKVATKAVSQSVAVHKNMIPNRLYLVSHLEV